MSTNLSGNILTLNNTSLDESYIKEINKRFYIPNNCSVGDTVILDGIECLCVATDVTIQGSSLTRIAIDKYHDLGYYQKYVGDTYADGAISYIRWWRWGGVGTALSNTSQEVGYGLQNTIRCLANTVVYTAGTANNNYKYPLMWRGVNDFRSSHSDKWFVPSLKEFKNYIYANRSRITFDTTTGADSTYSFWTSSEYSSNESYYMIPSSGTLNLCYQKYAPCGVRLCRAF